MKYGYETVRLCILTTCNLIVYPAPIISFEWLMSQILNWHLFLCRPFRLFVDSPLIICVVRCHSNANTNRILSVPIELQGLNSI